MTQTQLDIIRRDLNMDVKTFELMQSVARKFKKEEHEQDELLLVIGTQYYRQKQTGKIAKDTPQYLYRLFMNICISQFRKEKTANQLDTIPIAVIHNEDADYADGQIMNYYYPHETLEFNLMFNNFWSSIPKHDQQLLQDVMTEDSYETIAQKLNVSIGTIKSRVSRMRARLTNHPELVFLK